MDKDFILDFPLFLSTVKKFKDFQDRKMNASTLGGF